MTGLDWTGLGWAGLDWTGLGWTGLDRTERGWTGLDWTGAECGARRVWRGMMEGLRLESG